MTPTRLLPGKVKLEDILRRMFPVAAIPKEKVLTGFLSRKLVSSLSLTGQRSPAE